MQTTSAIHAQSAALFQKPSCKSVLRLKISLSLILWAQCQSYSGPQHYRTVTNCEEADDCVAGLKERIYIFSALRDPLEREVTLFVLLGNNGKDMNITSCIFTSVPDGFHKEPRKLALPATTKEIQDNLAIYYSFQIKCPDPVPVMKQFPSWVSVELNGHDVHLKVPLEEVVMVKKGGVAACAAPLFSDIFEETYQWLSHYTKLGVSAFYIYWTDAYLQWQEDGYVRSYPKGSKPPFRGRTDIQRPGGSLPIPVQHPLAEYIHFHTVGWQTSYYLGQEAIYNECLYRHRYEYEFIMFYDLDEFLVLKEKPVPNEGNQLLSWLQRTLPTQNAVLALYRWSYRRDCGEPPSELEIDTTTWLGNYSARAAEPEPHALSNNGDKLIVRPELIDRFYIHYIRFTRLGAIADSLTVPVTSAYIKHLRTYEKLTCENYTFLEPSDPRSDIPQI